MSAKRVGVLFSVLLLGWGPTALAQDAKTLAAAPRHKAQLMEVSGTSLDASVAHLAGRSAFASPAPVSQRELIGVLLLLSMHQAKARGA